MKFTDEDIAQIAAGIRKLSILRDTVKSPGGVLVPGEEAVKELGISGMRDPGESDPIFIGLAAKARAKGRRDPMSIITQKI